MKPFLLSYCAQNCHQCHLYGLEIYFFCWIQLYRAEIQKYFRLFFGSNEDIQKSLWNYLTFRRKISSSGRPSWKIWTLTIIKRMRIQKILWKCCALQRAGGRCHSCSPNFFDSKKTYFLSITCTFNENPSNRIKSKKERKRTIAFLTFSDYVLT